MKRSATTPSPDATCEVCRKPFVRFNTMQRVCGPACARKVPVIARKAEQAKDRAAWERLKTRNKWLAEAQASFNAWIKLRDGADPCISCRRHHTGQYHAGHWLSIGARPELRFDPANVHKQCQPCNTHLHGNLVLYRAALIEKIGPVEVARLEGPQAPVKLTIQDIKAIRDDFRAKVRALRAAWET